METNDNDFVSTSGFSSKNTEEPICLFNPNPAASWSILLTPIFGAYIVYHNWKVLDEREAQWHSRIWIIGLSVLYFILLFTPWLEDWATGLETVSLVLWYLLECRFQVKWIKNREIHYVKQSWLEPLSIGVPLTLGILIISIILYFFTGAPILITTSPTAYQKSRSEILEYFNDTRIKPLQIKESEGDLKTNDYKEIQALKYAIQLIQNGTKQELENIEFYNANKIVDYAREKQEESK